MRFQSRSKASAADRAAGPRIARPVSRHGASVGVPAHSSPTHIPLTCAISPSMTTSLRWSRCRAPNGLPTAILGLLKACTCTPAWRIGFQNESGVAQHPTQS